MICSEMGFIHDFTYRMKVQIKATPCTTRYTGHGR